MRTETVRNLDGEGFQRIILETKQRKDTAMYESKRLTIVIFTVLLAGATTLTQATAQNFVLKFESVVGQSTCELIEDLRHDQDFDYDGDGTPELLTKDWGAGALFAYSLPSAAPVWSLVLPAPERGYLNGFFDFDGDGTKEAVLDVQTGDYEYEIRIYSAQTGEVLLTLDSHEALCQDLDGDGLPELIADMNSDFVQVWGVSTTSAVRDGQDNPPNLAANLAQNHPNPFNPQTVIPYEIQTAAMSSLHILDVQGRRVRTLLNEFKQPGEYNVTWNGKDDNEQHLASGVYFYQLKVGEFKAGKKMVLLR